jgi:hypothetical protein
MTIQQIERQRNPFYKTFEKAWRELLFKQCAPYLKALEDPHSMNYIQSIPLDIKDTRTLFLKTWIIIGRSFAKSTQQEYKKSISLQYRTKDAAEDFFDNYMYNFAETEAGMRIVSIATTNKEAMLNTIRQALLKGEQEGLGAVEMSKYIQDALKEQMIIISRYSAERIARTEIVGASNRGQLLGAQTLGYNMNKTWLQGYNARTPDKNNPFNHAIHETVRLYDDFQMTGEPMQHPGDPKGSAGNVCNCNCGMTYEVL